MFHSYFRRIALRTFTAVLTVLPLMQAYVANAQEQRTVATASIPFDFSAGRTQLPAGNYHVVRIGDNMMRLVGVDAQHVASVMVYNSDGFIDGGTGKLRFHSYDGHCFLASVILPYRGTSVDVVKSRAEKEALRLALNPTASSSDIEVAFVKDAPQ